MTLVSALLKHTVWHACRGSSSSSRVGMTVVVHGCMCFVVSCPSQTRLKSLVTGTSACLLYTILHVL